MSQPSVKQALNRMNSGHVKVLEAFAKGEKVSMVGAANSAYIGIRKCAATLVGWGATENGQITQFGRDLLAAYHQRMDAARAVFARAS